MSEHHRSRAGIEAELDHAVGEHQNDDRADQDLGDGAATAAEADAAEDDRRQHRNLQADAGVGAGAAEARSIEQARQDRTASPEMT